jgi:hypothetical protein
MLYAKYIGRVAALAVALAVGMAVASTPGHRVCATVGFRLGGLVNGWVVGPCRRGVLWQI